MLANGLRLTLIVGSLGLIAACVSQTFQAFVWTQRARFLALALALMIVTGDQIERYGQPHLSWRAYPHLALLVLGVWGVLKFDPLSEDPT